MLGRGPWGSVLARHGGRKGRRRWSGGGRAASGCPPLNWQRRAPDVRASALPAIDSGFSRQGVRDGPVVVVQILSRSVVANPDLDDIGADGGRGIPDEGVGGAPVLCQRPNPGRGLDIELVLGGARAGDGGREGHGRTRDLGAGLV